MPPSIPPGSLWHLARTAVHARAGAGAWQAARGATPLRGCSRTVALGCTSAIRRYSTAVHVHVSVHVTAVYGPIDSEVDLRL